MARLLVVLAITLLAASGATAAPLGTGLASYYGAWHEGRLMANGRPYRSRHLTAASRVLPLGVWVRVVRPRAGRAVLVQITDRGPYVRGRILDLSRAAAAHLGMLDEGVVLVSVEQVHHVR